MRKVDLTGNIYSMLTVVKEVSGFKIKTYLCQCECGNEVFKSYSSLTAKPVRRKSCGCMRSKWASDLKVTHGRRIGGKYDPLRKKPSRLQVIWSGMKSRCINSGTYKDCAKHKEYKLKRVTIVQEWLIFSNFEKWALSNGYSESLSIDRINNSLGYNPSNCRWTTDSIQGQNSKLLNTANRSGYRGVSRTFRKSPWRAMVYLNNKAIFNKTFANAIDAAIARDMFVIEKGLLHTLNFDRELYKSHTQLEMRSLGTMIEEVLK